MIASGEVYDRSCGQHPHRISHIISTHQHSIGWPKQIGRDEQSLHTYCDSYTWRGGESGSGGFEEKGTGERNKNEVDHVGHVVEPNAVLPILKKEYGVFQVADRDPKSADEEQPHHPASVDGWV